MEKQIHSESDIPKWKRSPAYHLLCSFYSALSEDLANLGLPNNTSNGSGLEKKTIPGVITQQLISLFEKLVNLITKFPCVSDSRFGNRAFRDWHAAASVEISTFTALLTTQFPPSLSPNLLEESGIQLESDESTAILSLYLIESLGNATRIDYGTGHEMNFVIFLLIISTIYTDNSLHFISSDLLLLLEKYFALIRMLIKQYKLEPAGSHGVWGLDDYQFMPFLLGSAQLKKQPEILPTAVFLTDRPTVGLFFEGINFIHQYKSGPFSEHSPILSQICSTLSWNQINQGLGKMYRAQVMDKFPIVQHVYFCKLFPFE